ncbi:putative sterol carrier protein [Symbiobacterium terraclitae]|jgi:putative sterol carrier protein|uniref:Sterol carrier protein n=1 Tax=Symbiobacterium terraclitae TaxID=557451 RepID=A0ABS4JPR1_9FIRM|nr:SCP2 sterol-binding domain-containing protein [Symbiobacterium terraclitae]MBP2017533.1 putative sterol carrier protein [Symbiobacterium terraclitae]
MTIAELFENLKAQIAANPAKIANLKASYQFELTGEGGGVYHATFDNGTYELGEGPLPNPGCTITISVADFFALLERKLNPMAAFMSGKLKVRGDMGMAMKLQQLIG